MTLYKQLFPDKRSFILWPLALFWLAAIWNRGWTLFILGGKAVVVGGILMMFSPLPVAMLLTREIPDEARRLDRVRRRKARLLKRLSQRKLPVARLEPDA